MKPGGAGVGFLLGKSITAGSLCMNISSLGDARALPPRCPPLPCLCLLIILPQEGDTSGEKSCLGSIPGV